MSQTADLPSPTNVSPVTYPPSTPPGVGSGIYASPALAFEEASATSTTTLEPEMASTQTSPEAPQTPPPTIQKFSARSDSPSLTAAGVGPSSTLPVKEAPTSPRTPTPPRVPDVPGPFDNLVLKTPPKETLRTPTPRSHQRWRHAPMTFGPVLRSPHGDSGLTPPPAPTHLSFRRHFGLDDRSSLAQDTGSPSQGRERRVRFADENVKVTVHSAGDDAEETDDDDDDDDDEEDKEDEETGEGKGKGSDI